MPSPDWRDQIIYFLMIDRFDNGDTGNDDQGAGEFDPSSGAKFNGGDLAGVTRRLDYIRGLGATAVWITPPVANRWWDERGHYGGYHGYWAENFMAVDRHFGSLADYQALSRGLHAAGMYLVQDIVLNHTANYFSYGGDWNPADPAAGYATNPNRDGRAAPTQPPFDRNDPRDPEQRESAIYHWTSVISQFNDRRQELDFQLADLDDLNTENPTVRAALRKSYGYWVDQVGVDAFRVDTAFYVTADFLRDFLYSTDPGAPGILRVAQRSGRRRFHVFGEGFGLDPPYADSVTRKIDGYMRDSADAPAALPAMLNFPLYGTTADVFARGRPTAELAYRIRRMMQLHQHPHLMPSFVDNHDVDRFLAGGSVEGLKQALLLIMTLPGIPTIYYGTEQGFSVQRAAMFSAGYGAGGKDHFDLQAPLYRFLQRATALRREHRVLSRGTPTILHESAAGAGALAYKMVQDEHVAVVAFNSADAEVLVDNVDTGLAPGTRLHALFGIETTPEDVVVDAKGRVNLILPARSGWVWEAVARSNAKASAAAPARITLDPLPSAPLSEDLVVSGSATGSANLQLVIDGQLGSAQNIAVGADGRWRASVDTQSMTDPTIEHRIVALCRSARPGANTCDGTGRSPASKRARAGAPTIVSAALSFRVAREWSVLADIADPDGDDHGPSGRYEYPTDSGWRANRQADLRGVRVSASGGALKLDLRLHRVAALWNAPNGFDHVAFTLFIQLPDQADGATVMPLQNAELPSPMRWNYRLRAGGWTNAFFAAAGATATNEGTPVVPAADIRVDHATDTVSFVLPASALGKIASWSGAKIFVTTWDYDGGYRALQPQAQAAAFGGGDGARDALVMDDAIINL